MAGVKDSSSANAAAAYSAAMYYAITYVLTTVGSFGLIMVLARQGFEAEEINDFKGLSKRSPGYAVVMTVLMFSLAGVPPMMGFAAKFAVLQSVLASGAVWLTVFAVMFSLVGAFYYIRIVKVMWFDEATDTTPIVVNSDKGILLALNGLAVVVLGMIPGPLLNACMAAMSKTLAS
jgi:NADH-quinone oxidoreductase subunit N